MVVSKSYPPHAPPMPLAATDGVAFRSGAKAWDDASGLTTCTNFFVRHVEKLSLSAAFLPLTTSNPYAISAILRNLRELRKLLEFARICA